LTKLERIPLRAPRKKMDTVRSDAGRAKRILKKAKRILKQYSEQAMNKLILILPQIQLLFLLMISET
jgi:hypothetical protein